MINVGTMIGSGIFLVPSSVALYLMSPEPIILVWVIGGFVSLLGALSMAELGAAMPDAGGEYIYLRETYGRAFGFMSAFVSLLAGFLQVTRCRFPSPFITMKIRCLSADL